MDRLFNSMAQHPPSGKQKGKYSNASLGPWPEAVVASNIAGYDLSHSTNLEFTLYVAIISGKILETIANVAPTG
jgi:hypothetical protein